mgnify:CR=1 FL=1
MSRTKGRRSDTDKSDDLAAEVDRLMAEADDLRVPDATAEFKLTHLRQFEAELTGLINVKRLQVPIAKTLNDAAMYEAIRTGVEDALKRLRVVRSQIEEITAPPAPPPEPARPVGKLGGGTAAASGPA